MTNEEETSLDVDSKMFSQHNKNVQWNAWKASC